MLNQQQANHLRNITLGRKALADLQRIALAQCDQHNDHHDGCDACFDAAIVSRAADVLGALRDAVR